MRRAGLPLLLLLAACPGRLPGVLAPDPVVEAPAAPVLVGDGEGAAAALVGADPLLRRAPAPGAWVALPGMEPVSAWAQVAGQAQPQPADWWSLERSWPGTLAVPLARGARLADLESILAGGLRPEDIGRVVALLAPLADIDRTGPSDTRPALAWVAPASDPALLASTVLALAERAVLLGWLDGPALPTGPAARAMQPGVHDRLLESPTGALLVARAEGRRDPERAAQGRTHLHLATGLALAMAAADKDAEQVSLRETLAGAAATLTAQGHAVPAVQDGALRVALARAREELTADAGAPASAGLALVATTAERLRGHCPEGACRGLDRATTLRRASTWGDEAAAAAAAWRVVAAKEALDTLEVTAERPTFGDAMPELVDVLLAEGPGQVDSSLLRQRTAGPTTWLALTRAAGGADATEASPGLAALRALLVGVCDQALATALPEDHRALVQAIRVRAAG